MKPCPVCGYGNSDAALNCAVCGRDVSVVPVRPERRPEKESRLMLLAGLLLLTCGAAFIVTGKLAEKPPRPASGETEFSDEASFSYEGVLAGLDEMSRLRFLPREDKLKVLPLLNSRDERVAYAAAKLIGGWVRPEEDPADAKLWFDALLQAASAGGAAARGQAALELGLAAAFGFPLSGRLQELREAAAGLVASGDAELTGAGFFLASMSGIEDFSGEMLKTLRYDPSSKARLYAACSLARLGREEGYKHLLTAAGGPDPDLKAEALDCLSYSSAPETPAFLGSVAGGGDPGLAARAKRALIFRKQLAIIKK